MANWNKTLDISKEFSRAKSGEITNVELSRIIVEKLSNISYDIYGEEKLNEYLNKNLQDIIEIFQDIVDTEDNDVDSFDAALEVLYDFGDIAFGNSEHFSEANRTMFIKTF
jgi:hypothetical protein